MRFAALAMTLGHEADLRKRKVDDREDEYKKVTEDQKRAIDQKIEMYEGSLSTGEVLT